MCELCLLVVCQSELVCQSFTFGDLMDSCGLGIRYRYESCFGIRWMSEDKYDSEHQSWC